MTQKFQIKNVKCINTKLLDESQWNGRPQCTGSRRVVFCLQLANVCQSTEPAWPLCTIWRRMILINVPLPSRSNSNNSIQLSCLGSKQPQNTHAYRSGSELSMDWVTVNTRVGLSRGSETFLKILKLVTAEVIPDNLIMINTDKWVLLDKLSLTVIY